MSYNTRKGNAGYQTTGMAPKTGLNAGPTAAAVGQRRPVVTNNFISSGTLAGTQKPGGLPMTPQQLPPRLASQQTSYVQQQQQPQRVVQQPPPQQMRSQPVNVSQQQVQVKEEQPKIVFNNTPEPVVEQEQSQMDTSTNGEQGKKPKPAWMKNTGKINKKERNRRRNQKLVKILQPKNAIMVLNELTGNVTYNISEFQDVSPYGNNVVSYRASIIIDDQEHSGTGKTKMLAKSAAAESAIKHVVLKKVKTGRPVVPVSDVADSTEPASMEVEAENPIGEVLPWQHIASFALHKLFSVWDDTGNLTEKVGLTPKKLANIVPEIPVASGEKKPAKKMPADPLSMNPIMLLNQMMPNALFEEVARVGAPPKIMFTYQCQYEGKTFFGYGTNKKVAKKYCAFEACQGLLNIKYPQDVYDPSQNTQYVAMGQQ